MIKNTDVPPSKKLAYGSEVITKKLVGLLHFLCRLIDLASNDFHTTL